MAQLAIRGHATRGREVIELLGMLGGKNVYNLTGTQERWYILSNGTIEHSLYLFEEKGFSLEEFLEKFPHKVGDKVLVHDMPKTIKGINWDSYSNGIVYKVETNVRGFSEEYHVFANAIQPYKEETVKEKADTSMAPILQSEDYSDRKFGYKIPKGYEFDCIKENEIIIKPIKPQYPKTYEECCKIKHSDPNFYIDTHLYSNQLESLYKLLICRDAYWKIAGEQMGLGKPWEPNWKENNGGHKYCIRNQFNKVTYNNEFLNVNYILSFPTAEMRDVFYENFKELIELCKELL